MKLLACSDIHNNLGAVQALRAQEGNHFDAVLIAGDIGSREARQILVVFNTFDCPVYFVFGNWDNELEYFSLDCNNLRQVHLNGFELGDLYITGFSGCPTSWGQNPQAKALFDEVNQRYQHLFDPSSGRKKPEPSPEFERYQSELTAVRKKVLTLHRSALFNTLEADPIKAQRSILLTHERLTKLDQLKPPPFMHIYGHLHTYKHSLYKGTHFVDVACLDRTIPVSSLMESPHHPALGQVNVGGYSILHINKELTVTAERKHLDFDATRWVPLERTSKDGLPFISNEKQTTLPVV